MKVLFANKFFHMNGGSERVFFQERQFLLDSGVQVVDFSMEDERNFDSPHAEYFVGRIDYDGATGLGGKLKNGLSFVHSPEAVRKIRRLVQRESPRIAHLHNIYHQLTPSIIPALKKAGVKVVLTLHDYKLVCPSYLALKGERVCTACHGSAFWKPLLHHCQGQRLRELLLTAEGLWHRWPDTYDGVDLFLAPSQFLADMVSRRVAAAKIRVLRNGIDMNAYRPRYEDRGYGLYFGRLSREKGIETLLYAHRLLEESVPLKVVGTGPLEEKLRSRNESVEFLGYKSGSELQELVADAAFVVVPSEWYENCSMVVLEAMALGKPVIGSEIGGIPEQIDHGTTGMLFPMGDPQELAGHMQLLAADPERRQAMGRAARRKLEREYSLEAHCQNLMALYHGLLAES